MKSETRFCPLVMTLLIAVAFVFVIGCDSGGGGGDGEGGGGDSMPNSIDPRFKGWFLRYTDASFTVFDGDGFVLKDNGDIYDLDCNGDESDPNCAWYIDEDDFEGKFLSASDGKIRVIDFTYSDNPIDGTYTFNGTQVTIVFKETGTGYFDKIYD